jgi:WD40 repeat protein
LRNLTDHKGVVLSVAFDSTDLLASGSMDGIIKIWNKNSGDLARTLIGNHAVYSVAFSSKNILASGSNRAITLWDKNSGYQMRNVECHSNWIWQLAFDSNNLLVTGSVNMTVILWGT